MNISIVIPVYKSATTLRELHRRIGDVARREHWNCEIIYVNDASPDQSLSILRSLVPDTPFQIINLKQNAGQSSALIIGIAFATGDFIATMDADLQDEPEKLPELFKAMRPDQDVVFAKRTGHYESGGRLMTSFVFKGLVHLFSGFRIPMHAGLFMLARRRPLSQFQSYLPQSPYLIGLIARNRLRCGSVAVKRQKNLYGETSYTLAKRIRVAGFFFRTLGMKPTMDDSEAKNWIREHLLAEHLRYP
jgi:glycosyltransferase involved in cell wall biosynthesis